MPSGSPGEAHSVVATVRDPERARRLTSDAQRAGMTLEYTALDLNSPDEIETFVAALEAHGGVDALVNNAGYGVYGAVEDVGADHIARQFQVNVFGPLHVTRRLLPGLRQRRGRIIWIGSLAGRQSLAFQGHYSATKAATASISDALRMELEAVWSSGELRGARRRGDRLHERTCHGGQRRVGVR